MPRKRRREPERPDALISAESLRMLSAEQVQHDVTAEMAVVGAMVTERAAIPAALAILDAPDLHDPSLRTLFLTAGRMFREGEPVDPVTLRARFSQQEWGALGGDPALVEMMEAAPTAAAVGHYARIVKRWSIRREVKTRCLSLLTHADDPDRIAALIDILQQAGEPEEALVWLDELLAKEIPVEHLIDPLVPIGGVTVLLGDWEQRKSWVALSLCHALANGFEQWLGHYRILRRGGALYLDGENGDAEIRRRMALLDQGAGTTPTPIDPYSDEPSSSREPRPLAFRFLPRAAVLGRRVGALEADIRALNARLVVFDSAMSLAGPADLYKPAFWMETLPALKRLGAKTHSAPIVLHHLRKKSTSPGVRETLGERAFGSVAVMAQIDSCLSVDGERDRDYRILRQEKLRGGQQHERAFYLEFRRGDAGGLFLARGDELADEEAEARARAREIALEHAVPGKDYRTAELRSVIRAVMADEGQPISDESVKRALSELVNTGQMERVKRGVYRRGGQEA